MNLSLEDASWNFTDNRQWFEHSNKWPPVIVTCAITGGLHGKETHSGLPVTPEEQADAAMAAYEAGASMVHIHARSEATNYTRTSDQGSDFYLVNKLIRERCPDIIINNTGSGLFKADSLEQLDAFFKESRPEVASLDVGMFYLYLRLPFDARNLDEAQRQIYLKSGFQLKDNATLYHENVDCLGYTQTERFAAAMKANNVKPELEIFNSQCWWFVDNLIEKGLISSPYWCQLVFGQDGNSTPSSVPSALQLIDNLPPNSVFSSIGTGALELPMISLSMIMGGHVRVGMEDNIYFRKGEKVKDNAQLVKRAIRLVRELNREVASPRQARQILGISEIPRSY